MKLISMIAFVKEQGNIGTEVQSISHQQLDRAIRFDLIQKYADFLLKDVKKGMFVPCDEFDNILEEPLAYNFKSIELFTNYNIKYQEAKKRVLFEGFTIQNVWEDCKPTYSKAITNHISYPFFFNKKKKKWHFDYFEPCSVLADIVESSYFELNETALKEIGL
jgi:hypothetical protein